VTTARTARTATTRTAKPKAVVTAPEPIVLETTITPEPTTEAIPTGAPEARKIVIGDSTEAVYVIGSFGSLSRTELVGNACDEDITARYRETDIKGKAAIRKAISAATMSAVMGGDIIAAQALIALEKLVVSTKATEAVVIDPARILIDAVAELELAAYLLRIGAITPTGLELPDGFDHADVSFVAIDTSTVLESMWDEDPTRSASVYEAAKAFASAKRTKISSGDHKDIAEAIRSAFAGKASGAFLTVSQIANLSGSGTGAIAARLFPKNLKMTVEGVRAGTGGANNAKGAYLI
jgi:hypothetical protein